jgi:hypothetical protein
MIKTITLTEGTVLNAAAAQTAIDTKRASPFSGSGAAAVLAIHTAALAGTPTILVESSDDSTFPGSVAFPTTTVATVTPTTTQTTKMVTLSMNTNRYMRTRVSVAGSGGNFNAYLLGTT